MQKTKIIACIVCILAVFFIASCIPKADEKGNDNQIPSVNATKVNETTEVKGNGTPVNNSGISNTNLSNNVSGSTNVSASNSTLNVSKQENKTEIVKENTKPEAHGSSGEIITETTPTEEIIANYTIEDTLNVNLAHFEENFDWYKCKGSCLFECKSNSETFVVQDVEESGNCICKCSSGNEYLSKYFDNTEVKVISSTENSVNVEYKKVQ
jgi:hypothetical protein